MVRDAVKEAVQTSWPVASFQSSGFLQSLPSRVSSPVGLHELAQLYQASFEKCCLTKLLGGTEDEDASRPDTAGACPSGVGEVPSVQCM